MAALLEERDLSIGETLFEQGDEADALVLVVRGSVELASRRTTEKVAVGPGATIGVLALLAVGTRETSVVGSDASDLLLLSREKFLRFAEDHPRVAFRIAAAVAAEVAQHARAALAGRDASIG
jgi:CRP-like cAMP-binding protein